MRKEFLPFSFKALMACVLMLAGTSLHAQTDYTIGTGSSSNSNTSYPTPFGDYYEGSRQQFLFLASELTTAGMSSGLITNIKWDVTALNSSVVHEEYTIKIGTTGSSSLSTTGWESGTTVVYGPVSYSPSLGLNSFTLSTPFFWNGSSNIVVEVCHGDPNSTSGTYYTYNASVAYTVVSFNGSRTYRSDNVGNACPYVGADNTAQNETYRPNTTFTLVAGPPPSCPAPTGLTVTNVSATGADISWSAATGAAGYQYAVTTSATPPASGTYITGTGTTVSTLAPATSYYLHVRTVCGPADTSFWMTSASFLTNCATYVAPFTQSFDNGSTPNCWTNTGPELWLFSTGSGPAYGAAGMTDHTGNSGNFAWVDGSGTGTNTGITLTSPFIDIAALTTPQLRYYMFSNNTNTIGNNLLLVQALDNSTWVTVDSVQQNLGTSYVQRVASLSGLTSTTIKIRFVVDELNGIPSAFSAFHNDIVIDDISVQSAVPLAIDLQGISASNIGDRNRIDWEAASKMDGSMFVVERSLDGENFSKIGAVVANRDNKYTYWDEVPANGMNYYRLKIEDFNGDVSYSGVVRAMVKSDRNFVVDVYPNPARDLVTVKTYGAGDANAASVLLTDVTGKVLDKTSLIGSQAAINISDLRPGIYFIKYIDGNHDQTIRISKQ